MLSRRFGSGSRNTTATYASCSNQRRTFMKGMFGGKDKSSDSSSTATDSKSKEADPMAGMFPPGMGALGPKMMKEFMSKSPEQQMALMKQALEMQKKFGGNIPGLGKVTEKNAAMFESMIHNMEEKKKADASNGAKVSPTTSSAASSSSSSTASVSSSNSQQQRPTFKGANGPTLDELRKINLGAEIEELFTELGSMRAKRNHYRSELEKRETQLAVSQKEADEHKAKAADLRSRLSASENTIRLMNSEAMTLKSTLQTHKGVLEENKRLQVRVSALQSNDTTPLKERIVTLESELQTAQDSLKTLQRKLDRMRRRDLVAQFSHLLNDIKATAVVIGASSNDAALTHGAAADSSSHHTQPQPSPNTEAEAAWHDELFGAVQDAYAAASHGAWAQCAPSAAAALVAACESFILHAVGRSVGKLDAHVTLATGGSSSALEQLAKERGYEVAALPDHVYAVTMPADSAVPSGLGPYGVLAAYAATHPTYVAAVRPFISDALARNAKRVSVNTTTTRSGGPGGQAANTAETQVSMTLSLDGERLFVSEAQDTRSQVANKGLAETRLFAERLALHNKKLAGVKMADLSKVIAREDNADGDSLLPEAHVPITTERWEDMTRDFSSAIAALGAADKAIVESTRKALTTK